MAYKRPLSSRQSIIIALMWLVLVYLLVCYSTLGIFSRLVVVLASGFFVWYPIYRSHRQTRGTR